jgi:hypothetical protein
MHEPQRRLVVPPVAARGRRPLAVLPVAACGLPRLVVPPAAAHVRCPRLEARMAQLDPNDASTSEADPYPNDPFFKRKFDGTDWNACIGKQGDEQS